MRLDLGELFNDVVRFEVELWDVVDKRLRETHHLTLARFETMHVIHCTARCRVNNIAEALSITVGGTSKIVDRIEASGLCRRAPDPDDGRSSLIELTPDGRRLFTDAAQTFLDELELRLGSSVSAESLEQFATTVRQLRDGLRRGNGAEPSNPSPFGREG